MFDMSIDMHIDSKFLMCVHVYMTTTPATTLYIKSARKRLQMFFEMAAKCSYIY